MVRCGFAAPHEREPLLGGVNERLPPPWFEKLGFNSWRIVNQLDWAPTVPPPLLGFWHVETEYSYNSASSTVISFMCVHALETYLHLLDPKQPLQNQCIWSPRLTATAPSRAQTGPIPAAAALSASTEKQIALPHEGSSTTIPARSKRRKSSTAPNAPCF